MGRAAAAVGVSLAGLAGWEARVGAAGSTVAMAAETVAEEVLVGAAGVWVAQAGLAVAVGSGCVACANEDCECAERVYAVNGCVVVDSRVVRFCSNHHGSHIWTGSKNNHRSDHTDSRLR